LIKLYPKALIASNTTFLNPFELAKTAARTRYLLPISMRRRRSSPGGCCKGPETDMANVELMVELLRKMGKKPILFKKYVSGYAISRLQLALQREVYYLIDEGYLTPREVDDACILGLAMRMMIVGAGAASISAA
jgi:3-hydroxybutyryl-CoA dehydrogenase